MQPACHAAQYAGIHALRKIASGAEAGEPIDGHPGARQGTRRRRKPGQHAHAAKRMTDHDERPPGQGIVLRQAGKVAALQRMLRPGAQSGPQHIPETGLEPPAVHEHKRGCRGRERPGDARRGDRAAWLAMPTAAVRRTRRIPAVASNARDKASVNLPMSAWLCAALSAMRRRLVPRGTVGGRMAVTSTPHLSRAWLKASARHSSPTRTGTIWVLE